ncbi:MAG: copper resistance CopC family protein, partial [Thermomicrobiales bacterium]
MLASASATAHAELVRSSPPADALLAVPPRQIDLWMSESVASGAGSPIVRVLDEAGRDLKTGQATVAADDPTHLTASVSGVGSGTFTVVWTSRSADDGHVLTGSFAFRAGGTARAPGAATVEGETPSPWAVVTRWLTFLGASIAAAGFAFALLFAVQSSGDVGGERRRNGLIASAAGVALVATITEPLLPSLFSPLGALQPVVGGVLAALP